jgi:hypothetical protein
MTVTRNPVNGSLTISRYVKDLGYLVTQTYYDYTRKEAVSLFREHVRDLKDQIIKEKRK